MQRASIRDLRNRGGDIVTLAAAGEPVTITRAGEPVAELRALGPQPLDAPRLLARWKGLPIVDSAASQRDIDATIDGRL
jgi:antitoxin (DNA-binding transcriptional repressor) of toxin-antitoxin stability system